MYIPKFLIGLMVAAYGSTGDQFADMINSGFNGRWRVDQSKLVPSNDLDRYLLSTKYYFVGATSAGVRIPTNGRFYVTKESYCQAMRVIILSARKVEQSCKANGQQVYETTYSLSADLNELRTRSVITSNPDGSVSMSSTVRRRIGPAAHNYHSLSGSWKTVSVTTDDGPSNDWIISAKGKSFSLWSGGGVGYDAEIGGKPVAVKGDIGGGISQLEKISFNSVTEIALDKEGKPAAKMILTLSEDGARILVTSIYLKNGATSKFELIRAH